MEKVMATNGSGIVMEEITDAEELAAAHVQRELFDRNAAWLQSHAEAIYSKYRGKCICIAGCEVFAAPSSQEALDLAEAAHPEDIGRFVQYISKDLVPRIYAHPR